MPMPKDIGVIDLMLAVPGDDTSHFYEWIKPMLMDKESHDMFKMPAQYMFKDIPDTGKQDDYIAYTLEQMIARVERGRKTRDIKRRVQYKKRLSRIVAQKDIWQTPGETRGWFAVALALISAGAVFSLLDVTRTWCDPTHPVLQGHAIWHVLSALSLGAAFLHFRQLTIFRDA